MTLRYNCVCSRTCPTRTSIGTRPASFAPPAESPLSTNSSDLKATGSTAEAVTTNSSPPGAMDATRSSELVSWRFYSCSSMFICSYESARYLITFRLETLRSIIVTFSKKSFNLLKNGTCFLKTHQFWRVKKFIFI